MFQRIQLFCLYIWIKPFFIWTNYFSYFFIITYIISFLNMKYIYIGLHNLIFINFYIKNIKYSCLFFLIYFMSNTYSVNSQQLFRLIYRNKACYRLIFTGTYWTNNCYEGTNNFLENKCGTYTTYCKSFH